MSERVFVGVDHGTNDMHCVSINIKLDDGTFKCVSLMYGEEAVAFEEAWNARHKQSPVDVESLKRQGVLHPKRIKFGKPTTFMEVWDICIDHLASQGHITTPRHIEVMKVMRDAMTEIREYDGGAENALADEYVMERFAEAIAACDEVLGHE